MAKTREFNVRTNCSGMTVFHFLKHVLPRNRSPAVINLIRDGFVELNGSPAEANTILHMGDYLCVNAEALDLVEKRPVVDTLEVLYRDEALICINKPAGMSVVPDRRPIGKTAVQICREMLAEEGLFPRPVHRIDKWTSGILLLALRKEYVETLGRLFADRRMDKTYLAFVRGRPDPPEGEIDEPIGPNAKRMTRIVTGGKMSKPALTRYRTLSTWQGFSLVEAKPETGRTHQIRVHLSHIGHPVLCDSLYGGGDALCLSEFKLDYKLKKGRKERPLLSRQALHAAELSFISPANGQKVNLKAGLPHDLEVLKKKLDQYGEPSH